MQQQLFAGVDWASKAHAVCVVGADGAVRARFEVPNENVNEKWPHRARQKWPHPRGLSGSAQPRWVANRDGPGEAITASLGGSFLGRAGRPQPVGLGAGLDRPGGGR